MKPEVPIRPGEYVLWSGEPDRSVIFAPGDAFLIPFGLLFTAFTVFWLVAASHAGAFPIVWGSAFLLFGLYYLVGRFFVKAWRKATSVYAITDRRALAVIGGSAREIALPAVALWTSRSRDGRHMSVDFEFGGSRYSLNAMASRVYRNSGLDFFDRSSAGTVSFFDVADVEGLSAALDRAQAPKR